jgi:hypothetical protein
MARPLSEAFVSVRERLFFRQLAVSSAGQCTGTSAGPLVLCGQFNASFILEGAENIRS